MRKVTTINLNNNAFQVDEEAYAALRDYLATAERNLAGNPDRTEILADLEQAIADKCRACTGAHKNVVTHEDIEHILKEMGPVVAPASQSAGGAESVAGAGASSGPAHGHSGKRRLYRIEEGRMWAGVCTGLAAYFGFDPVWVRVAFILLTVFTSGIWLLIYLAMCFIVPMAETAEERAAAYGAPFNAQELIDRVKKKSEGLKPDFAGHRAWRQAKREARREARRERQARQRWWQVQESATPRPAYAARVLGGIMLPILTVLSAAWFAALAAALLVTWSLYEGFGFGFPPWHTDVPRWVAMLLIVVVYALIAMPLGAIRRSSLYYANGGRHHGWADAWSGLLWLLVVVVAAVAAWQLSPAVQETIRGLLQSHPPAVAGWI